MIASSLHGVQLHCKVSGRVRTWATRPYGLRGTMKSGYIGRSGVLNFIPCGDYNPRSRTNMSSVARCFVAMCMDGDVTSPVTD